MLIQPQAEGYLQPNPAVTTTLWRAPEETAALQRPPRPLVLAVDYDLTLDLAPWPAVGRLAPGAKEAMLHFKAQGHTLIVWTCRSGKEMEAALAFLREAGVPFDYANENTPELIALYGCDCRKISADLYLDDRAVGTPNNWAAYRRLVDSHAYSLA